MTMPDRETIPITRENVRAVLDFSKMSDQYEGRTIGLVPAVVQDADSREILMVAFMSEGALDKTLDTGMATFWTRSRKALWTKGETSNNFMKVTRMEFDCDADTVVMQVQPQGDRLACHTHARSCFYRGFDLS